MIHKRDYVPRRRTRGKQKKYKKKRKVNMTLEIETCKDLSIMLNSVVDDCDFCKSSFYFKSIEMKNLEYSMMKKTHDENLRNAVENCLE